MSKSALNLLYITAYPLPYFDMASIEKHLFAKWQHLWHNLTSNELHNIHSSLPVSIKLPETNVL